MRKLTVIVFVNILLWVNSSKYVALSLTVNLQFSIRFVTT